jgi:hypothetical protein
MSKNTQDLLRGNIYCGDGMEGGELLIVNEYGGEEWKIFYFFIEIIF